jgi:protocatechuate 3,4-dioxygenase beta subunit
MRTLLARLGLSIGLLLASACGGPPSRPGAEALVTGTVLDASTGVPVPGARIDGPGGTHAVSGSDGRFELQGLRERDEGEVLAQTDDGRRGSVHLRPLAPGRLEIALHLARR